VGGFFPGVNHKLSPGRRPSNPEPYGSVWAGPNSCGGIAVPQGWLWNEDRFYDFAVFDFTNCGSMPTSQTGYSGVFVNWGGGSSKVYGYPGSGCPGGGQYPSLCGHSGTSWLDGGWRLSSDNIDATEGQSGGPWMTSTNYVAATHIGSRWFSCGVLNLSTCRRNYGRRVDSLYWSFVQGYAVEY
jgi:hypothetical protein